ncbi:ATP-binding protein [Myxococcota bacterium]|nr:ATP-binding protein [Myxococcota bacterium]
MQPAVGRPVEATVTSAGRLFLLSVLPLAAACGGLFWFFVVRLDLAADEALERRAASNAAAVARGVAASFEYEDAGEVDRHLESLAELPDLHYAAVLTADGRVFGAHRPEHRPEVIARPRDGARLRWAPDVLHVVAPIQTRGGREGTLAMGFSLAELRSERRTTMLVVGAAVGMVLAGGGFVAWLLAHYLGRRRAAEAAQRRSEESFRALIETLPDAILIERDGRVVYANPAAVRHLGVSSPAAIYGRPAAALLRVSAHGGAHDPLVDLHVVGHPVSLPDVQLVRPDGTTLAAEVLALPLVFDAAPAGVLVARDLTERRRIQAQLIHADRMASMGTMAAGVAHEINNPMAYVTTNLSFALDELERRTGGQADDEVRQALHEALEGAERVRHIVQSLKTYSRAEDETIVPVDVERALDAAISMARAEMRTRAELVRTRGGVPLVSGQESRLVQVLVNLLTNAAQAIPAGAPEQNRIEVETAVSTEGMVVVSVTDTGSGIAPEHVARLFDPFFTTKPVGEGTGLGLSICHGIVTGLGGEIRVSSQPGAGSRFEVWLPPRPADVSTTGAVPEPVLQSPIPDAAPRVLVVDDEPRIAASISRLFAREMHVQGEASARRALARLGDDPMFDAVVCDLMMPEMGGIELYEEIRHRWPKLARRVVFLTGGAFTPEAAAFLEAVPNPVLSKPFDPEELRAAIEGVLRRSGDQPAAASRYA